MGLLHVHCRVVLFWLVSLTAVFMQSNTTRDWLKLARNADGERWSQQVELKKGELFLFWNSSRDEVIWRVYAKTAGWFGIGLSPNGGMYSSDIVVFSGDKPTATDMYVGSSGSKTPKKDDKQDWELLDSIRDGGWVKVTFKRKTDTCDRQHDLLIRAAETQRLIWAMSADGKADLEYHFKNRGIYSVLMLRSQNADDPLPEDAQSFDIRMTNFTIPNYSHTLWWCQTIPYTASLRKDKYHVLKVEPIIVESNTDYVHHMVVHACFEPKYLTNSTYHNLNFQCFNDSFTGIYQDVQRNCVPALFVWAKGGTNFTYPKEVALPMGGENERVTMFRLEVHYDNQNFVPGILNRS